jgi:hypothetical protein
MTTPLNRVKRLYRELIVRRDREGARLAERILAERLSFLGLVPLLELRARVLEADRRGSPGV